MILHCFSLPEHLDEVVERGWYVSFAGNVTYPSASDLADAARRVPAELLLLETDCPYLSPLPHRGTPNRPHYVLETLRAVAEPARRRRRRAGRAGRGERRARLRTAMNAPRQVTLARLAELGLRPDRELGQHFLVDDNVLGVIERLADLRPEDVVLEIGAGVGTLTARLAGSLRARARGRDRPAPRAGAHAHAGRARERDGALGRCDAPRPARPRSARDRVRGQPAVPRRGAARARLDRRSARRAALVRARAAGDRRAAHRRARRRALRRAQRAVRARARAGRPPRRLAQRVRARAERRLDPGRVHAPARVAGARRRLAAHRRDRARGLRVPPQDARQRAHDGGLARGSRCASRRPAAPPASIPRRAPRRCRPRRFVALARAA